VSEVDTCRACGAPTSPAFETTVLGRYRVNFLRCHNCESLQSEPPYWLGEAYTSAIAATDTGAMVRNLVSQAAVCVIAAMCRVRGRFLDYGGGAGVLCRMLRDSGFDAYLTDKYSDPVFARAYALSGDECQPGGFALISAVEVLEHYVDPAGEIGRLFALAPQVLVATTQLYAGEGEGWWYLSRQTGQHIFFYSRKCLDLLARRHGYHYLNAGWFHVFSARPIGWIRRGLLRCLLSNVGLGIVRLWQAARLRGHFANQDNARVCAQLEVRQAERSND
jgi:hypothetical protein